MPYCSQAIKLDNECDWPIEDALAAIGQELFNAEAIHLLHGNSYNIDDGVNDVRAIVNTEESLVCFFCRYEKDITKIDEKLAAFVTAHSEQYELVEVDRKGIPTGA